MSKRVRFRQGVELPSRESEARFAQRLRVGLQRPENDLDISAAREDYLRQQNDPYEEDKDPTGPLSPRGDPAQSGSGDPTEVELQNVPLRDRDDPDVVASENKEVITRELEAETGNVADDVTGDALVQAAEDAAAGGGEEAALAFAGEEAAAAAVPGLGEVAMAGLAAYTVYNLAFGNSGTAPDPAQQHRLAVQSTDAQRWSQLDLGYF